MNKNTKGNDATQKGSSNKERQGANDGRRYQNKYATSFKGETAKMKGKIFQLLAEQ